MRSRFDCASSSLVLSGLLRRARPVLWGGLGLAVAVHLSLLSVRGLRQEQQVAKPLTTQFVKRQPRLTKPLELKKRPQPKRRQVRREMVSLKAKASRQGAGIAVAAAGLGQSLASPRMAIARGPALGEDVNEPEALAQQIVGSKESRHTVDMALEMVDIEALDTGRYHAVVIQDPADKRNIRGFFRMSYVYSVRMLDRDEANAENRLLLGLHRLVDAINEYTEIKASFGGAITLGSQELLKAPWVFIGSQKGFRLADSEAENLGRYLEGGGFVLAEDGWPGINKLWTPGYTGLYQMLVDALGRRGLAFGRDWTFEQIPDDHPVCRCYFDFDAPPRWYWYQRSNRGDAVNFPVNGITIEGRLYAILDRRGYAHTWANLGPGGAFGDSTADPTREFQFGVNLVVFALTQEGSITHRLMDAVQ